MANIIEEKIKQGAFVVDVRTEDEFMDGAFPGAVNIPLGELQQRFTEFEPKERSVILYCASGARSAMAARILKSAGWKDVVNAGGLYDMPGM